MHRGIIRHEKLQLAFGRNVKRVADLTREFPQGSHELCQVLSNMAVGCCQNTPVYVFKEVSLNRVLKRSRRADLVFYVPRKFLLYVEYKTIETSTDTPTNTTAHEVQLRETHNNLITNLTYKLSMPPLSPVCTDVLPVYTLLLTRRFYRRKSHGDVAVPFCPKVTRGIHEPRDPNVLIRILAGMGRYFK